LLFHRIKHKDNVRFDLMAEISRFYGIIIHMYGGDHNPPHFHVKFNKYRAIFAIESGELLHGSLPVNQLKIAQAWTYIHKLELLQNFQSLRAEIQTYKKIKPLE
jgi:hypothetical protein